MSMVGQLKAAMEHQVAGRFGDAESIYLGILKDNPDQPDAIHLLGLIRMEQDRDGEALELMERALVLFPAAAHFHHNIAGLYRRMGQLEEAEQQFREAIELKPDYGEAYQGLAEMKRFDADDPLFSKISEQLAQPGLPADMRSYFHFAAGALFDGIGQYKEAFEHYRQGNDLAARKFDTDGFRKLAKDIIYTSSPSLAKRTLAAGYKSRIPTFIIGMPRSGTTLVEQILASHSCVFGAGELNDLKLIAAQAGQLSTINAPYPAYLPGLNSAGLQRMGSEYVKRVQRLVDNQDVTRIIDKHPLNFQYVGMIFSMFPDARVIHTVRDPLDTCLSCYFQNFTKGQDYSFDLVALGHFYNDYSRLMEHWESVYTGRICSVKYETVVDQQESETRRMLDYLGLEFEAACIDFHKTDRKVSTASFMQVRKPIYKTSQNRWMNYRTELRELAKIIGVAVEEPITITGTGALRT